MWYRLVWPGLLSKSTLRNYRSIRNFIFYLIIHFSQTFEIYQYLVIIFFSLLGFSSLKGLYNNLKASKEVIYKRKWLGTFKNPVNMSMLMVLLICITKLLWITIDPYIFYGILHRSVERVLAEIIYSLLYCLYSMVLMVW